MSESVIKAKAEHEATLWALVNFILTLEPQMPLAEARSLAEGTLSVLIEWSCGGKPLPEMIGERLTLAPWKR